MGGLEIRNKSLRCEKCLDIKRLTIFPQYPEPILKMECRCSEKNTKLFEFLTEFKKKENFVIKCSKCQNINPKITKYFGVKKYTVINAQIYMNSYRIEMKKKKKMKKIMKIMKIMILFIISL